jgi:hypothetical protein
MHSSAPLKRMLWPKENSPGMGYTFTFGKMNRRSLIALQEAERVTSKIKGSKISRVTHITFFPLKETSH